MDVWVDGWMRGWKRTGAMMHRRLERSPGRLEAQSAPVAVQRDYRPVRRKNICDSAHTAELYTLRRKHVRDAV